MALLLVSIQSRASETSSRAPLLPGLWEPRGRSCLVPRGDGGPTHHDEHLQAPSHDLCRRLFLGVAYI